MSPISGSRAVEHAAGDRLTRTGLTLGTPQYMAPEQAAGERALDARIDVYALGAVLYEMLAGEPPFAAESRQAVLQRLLTEPPAPLATRRTQISPLLDAAVQRALAKRPVERFPSASAFAAALAAPPERSQSMGIAEHAAHAEAGSTAVASSTKRMVTARVAVYAALAGVGVGLTSGWGLARSPFAGRWRSDTPAVGAPPIAVSNVATADVGVNGAAAMRGSWTDGLSLVIVDRAGSIQRTIPANRPWTPRFSPDGSRVAYGAYGPGRGSSDVWVTDLKDGTTRRLTDDDADSNDPQWSPDGAVVAYSVNAPGGKDVAARRLSDDSARVLATRDGGQFPNDWVRDGSALIVTDEAGANAHDILVQPSDGSAPWPYVAKPADETAARVSPDGHWIAYTSNESGRAEVYLDSYPRPKRRIMVSQGGGIHPVWRGDGRELYYWRDDALVAVQLGAARGDRAPAIDAQTVLFRAPYEVGINTMYDVSADGQRFVIVRRH